MRGGTSKGIYLDRKHLPADPAEWGPIFRGIMGSPDPHSRQLNGMGGGISSLSKICVVGPPASVSDGYDIEYTFVQVGVDDGVLDFSGNCGNLATAVGVFALDEKMIRVPSLEMIPGEDNTRRKKATIKLRNTNTNKTIRTTFPVSLNTGLALLVDPDIEVAGVSGKGSRVVLEFMDPAGAKTGKLLPTGKPTDTIPIEGHGSFEVSCVDATNPTVFANGVDFAGTPDETLLPLLELIRQAAAVRMGLDQTSQAQPKICLVWPASGREGCDVVARALSMGVWHKAIPSTVGLCLAAAAGIDGTIVQRVGEFKGPDDLGTLDVKFGIVGGVVGVRTRIVAGEIKSVGIERTARRLMRGEVFW